MYESWTHFSRFTSTSFTRNENKFPFISFQFLVDEQTFHCSLILSSKTETRATGSWRLMFANNTAFCLLYSNQVLRKRQTHVDSFGISGHPFEFYNSGFLGLLQIPDRRACDLNLHSPFPDITAFFCWTRTL